MGHILVLSLLFDLGIAATALIKLRQKKGIYIFLILCLSLGVYSISGLWTGKLWIVLRGSSILLFVLSFCFLSVRIDILDNEELSWPLKIMVPSTPILYVTLFFIWHRGFGKEWFVASSIIAFISGTKPTISLFRGSGKYRYAGTLFLVTLILLIIEGIYDYRHFLPAGTFLTTIFLFFCYLLLNERILPDLKEISTRAVSVAITSIIMATLYYLFFTSRSELGPVGDLFNLFVASIILFLLFDPLRNIIEWLSFKMLYRRGLKFKNTIERLSRECSSLSSPEACIDLLFEMLETTKRASKMLWYKYQHNPEGLLLSLYRPSTLQDLKRIIRREDPLFKDLIEGNKEHLDFQLIYQVNVSGKLHSIVCIGNKNLTESFSTEEKRSIEEFLNMVKEHVEHKSSLENAIKKERLQIMGGMAAALAHELRSPMSVIKGVIENLEYYLKGNQKTKEYAKMLHEETDRMDRLIEEFLSFSRPTDIELKSINLIDLLFKMNKFFSQYCKNRKIDLILDLPDSVKKKAKVSPERLRDVLFNLLTNACDAAGEGGKVLIRLVEKRYYFVLYVVDSGRGVPDNIADKIFDPFFTTKSRGTGLGLAIVKRYLEEMACSIELVKEKGDFGDLSGAAFMIKIQAE